MIIFYIYLAGTFAVAALMTFVEVSETVAGRTLDFDRIADMLFIASWPLDLFLMTMELVCGLSVFPIGIDLRQRLNNALENFRFIGRSP